LRGSVPAPVIPATATSTAIGLSALVALVVSALVSGGVRFGFDEALAARRAARDYAYERRKDLHSLVGRFDGRLLETGTDLYVRLRNIAETADSAWLAAPSAASPPGYFLASTVYRFMALMRLAVAFDREAIYFDPEIASRHDLRCIQYAKAFQWVMTDVTLFAGTGYDVNEATDHFFRDELRTICTLPVSPDTPLVYEEFCTSILPTVQAQRVQAFFTAFSRESTPLRWDRVVALQLLLAGFIDGVSYLDTQRKHQPEFNRIAADLTSLEIRRNLLRWIPEQLGHVDRGGSAKISRALKGVISSPREVTVAA
jgi:hypothetical protein